MAVVSFHLTAHLSFLPRVPVAVMAASVLLALL